MNNTYVSITQFQQLVQLKDYRPPTRKEYVRMVRKLAEHFQCDPATLSEDHLRTYFLFLREQKHLGRSAMSIAKAALRCFFTDLLHVQGWTVFADLRIAQPLVLPVVLTRQETATLLAALREPRFITCLRLIYHCGLRVGEAVRLEVRDILSRQVPPRLHIRQGKGGKDRLVPLAPPMVEDLRLWWKTHRHPQFLFPSPGRAWKERNRTLSERLAAAKTHLSVSAVQLAFRLARAQSGIRSDATVHTLRHCYATHLLEEGVSLRQISQYLGHGSLQTTLVYTHLTAVSEAKTQAALTTLYRQINPRP